MSQADDEEEILGDNLKQVPEQLVTLFLGVDEDEYLALLLPLAQQLKQAHESILRLPDLNELGNVFVDNATPSHLDLDW